MDDAQLSAYELDFRIKDNQGLGTVLPLKDCAEMYRYGRKVTGNYTLQTGGINYSTHCRDGWTYIMTRNQLGDNPVRADIIFIFIFFGSNALTVNQLAAALQPTVGRLRIRIRPGRHGVLYRPLQPR
jgi:hypothetical protein